MAYEKYTWVTGEVITQEKLNHMEDGIAEAFTDDMKEALLACFDHVAWADDSGAARVAALRAALYDISLESISAVYTQSGTVYTTDSLDSLKSDLVVTALYSDGTTETVPSSDYTLSGTLEEGTSTITVSYEGKTDDFDVTVSVRSIKVYNGKGTSGTSIVDNANRALSEMIYVGDSNLTTQNDAYESVNYSAKFTTSTTTVESQGYVAIPESYIGTTTAALDYDAWATTDDPLVFANRHDFTVDGKWEYSHPTSGYIRLLFKNATDPTSPIPEISGTIQLMGLEYRLIEMPASDFE